MAIIEMSGTAGCIEACHGCLNARKLTEKSDISTVVDTAHKIRAAFPGEVFHVMVHDTPSATGVDVYNHPFFQNLRTLQVGMPAIEQMSGQVQDDIRRVIDMTRSPTFTLMGRIGNETPDQIISVAREWLQFLSAQLSKGVAGCSFTNNTFRLPEGSTLSQIESQIYALLSGFWGSEETVTEMQSIKKEDALQVTSTQFRVGNTQSIALRYLMYRVGIQEPPQKVDKDGGGVFITPSGVHFEHDASFMGKTFLPTEEALRLLSRPCFAWLGGRDSFDAFVQRGLDETFLRRKK